MTDQATSPAAPVAVSTPPAAPPSPRPTPTAPELTRQQKIANLLWEKFAKIEPLSEAMYSHRGSCTKCGWQTHQHSEADASTLLAQHVMNHWRDVASSI